jgi:hypothetical protein
MLVFLKGRVDIYEKLLHMVIDEEDVILRGGLNTQILRFSVK